MLCVAPRGGGGGGGVGEGAWVVLQRFRCADTPAAARRVRRVVVSCMTDM